MKVKYVIKKCIRKIKFSVNLMRIFFISTILIWIMFFLYIYAWINIKDNVSDKLMIIMIILTVVMVIAALDILVGCIYNIKEKEKEKKAKKTIIILFLVIVFHGWMMFEFINFGGYISGGSSIISKNIEDGKYYFSILDVKNDKLRKIECDKKIYEVLVIDEKVNYVIEYRWLKFIENKGYLENINTIDIIDNRNKGN